MTKFLGEKLVKIEDSPFAEYTMKDWVLYFITLYGGIDGAHHKDWVMDQVVRICHGCKFKIKKGIWDDGLVEWRIQIVSATKEYKKWVQEITGPVDENGETEYYYDCGIAP